MTQQGVVNMFKEYEEKHELHLTKSNENQHNPTEHEKQVLRNICSDNRHQNIISQDAVEVYEKYKNKMSWILQKKGQSVAFVIFAPELELLPSPHTTKDFVQLIEADNLKYFATFEPVNESLNTSSVLLGLCAKVDQQKFAYGTYLLLKLLFDIKLQNKPGLLYQKPIRADETLDVPKLDFLQKLKFDEIPAYTTHNTWFSPSTAFPTERSWRAYSDETTTALLWEPQSYNWFEQLITNLLWKLPSSDNPFSNSPGFNDIRLGSPPNGLNSPSFIDDLNNSPDFYNSRIRSSNGLAESNYPNLSPARRLSPSFSPARRLSPSFSPARRLSPSFSPAGMEPPVGMLPPTGVLSPTGMQSPIFSQPPTPDLELPDIDLFFQNAGNSPLGPISPAEAAVGNVPLLVHPMAAPVRRTRGIASNAVNGAVCSDDPLPNIHFHRGSRFECLRYGNGIGRTLWRLQGQ
jgi:hypothetical protein